MSDNNTLLKVRDLHVEYKIYRGVRKVLTGINLNVKKGERVGVVGETGCGKTTTLRSIMRILPAAARVPQGTIEYNGANILDMEEEELLDFRRRGAAMVFQDPSAALNPVFTVGQLMGDAIRNSGVTKGGSSKSEVNERARAALAAVALPDPDRILENYPFQLSGGMRQRVCIAMALAVDKDLLLADEPGTSLDVTIQDQILRLINTLVADDERSLSVVLVSHSLGVIRECTDKTYVMYAGSIVEEAPTSELFANPCHPYTYALLDCVPKLSGMGIAHGIPGSMPDYLKPPTGCRFHPRCPRATAECREAIPTIRPVAPDHTVACFRYDSTVGDTSE